jgi:hypothetical protein
MVSSFIQSLQKGKKYTERLSNTNEAEKVMIYLDKVKEHGRNLLKYGQQYINNQVGGTTEEDIKYITEKLTEAKNILDNLPAKKEEVKLVGERKKSSSEKKDLEERLKAMEIERTRNMSNLMQCQIELGTSGRQLLDFENHIKDISRATSTSIQNRDEEIKKLMKERDEFNEVAKRSLARLRELTNNIESLNNNLEQARKTIEVTTNTNIKLREEKQKMTEELERYRDILENMTQRMQEIFKKTSDVERVVMEPLPEYKGQVSQLDVKHSTIPQPNMTKAEAEFQKDESRKEIAERILKQGELPLFVSSDSYGLNINKMNFKEDAKLSKVFSTVKNFMEPFLPKDKEVDIRVKTLTGIYVPLIDSDQRNLKDYYDLYKNLNDKYLYLRLSVLPKISQTGGSRCSNKDCHCLPENHYNNMCPCQQYKPSRSWKLYHH